MHFFSPNYDILTKLLGFITKVQSKFGRENTTQKQSNKADKTRYNKTKQKQAKIKT